MTKGSISNAGSKTTCPLKSEDKKLENNMSVKVAIAVINPKPTERRTGFILVNLMLLAYPMNSLLFGNPKTKGTMRAQSIATEKKLMRCNTYMCVRINVKVAYAL